MHKLSFFIVFFCCITTGQAQLSKEKFWGLQGNIKSIIETLEGDNAWKRTYTFTREGDIIDIITVGKTGEQHKVYEYNKQNQLICITEYEDSVIVRQQELIRQDGYRQEWKITAKDDLYYTIEEWSPETNILWFALVDENRDAWRVGYRLYDKRGNLIKLNAETENSYPYSHADRNSYMIFDRYYKYNDRNEILEVKFVYIEEGGLRRDEQPIFFWTYPEHDHKGNWTKQEEEGGAIFCREYIYYP